MTSVYYLDKKHTKPFSVTFDRKELGMLLSIYSQRVARGEWRDYAIDLLDDCAVFSIFRHAHETPLFAIIKAKGHKNRYDEFTVFNGQKRLTKSRNLPEALSVFDKQSHNLNH
ncbi:DUF2794 domain-containing protein [Kiloniella laminariae]|uniref:DUF2794 domain-containing protein n=1 Tax=Kiloniella laminariae TaxID=454162 RepID=A0ABT4LH41_9PROT|nr:DUF2794 domain-containing protein [Kiloniella laminariae]MCZ4280418.1 DUF2794 domain-containing protein [Kiloniella laminariae]